MSLPSTVTRLTLIVLCALALYHSFLYARSQAYLLDPSPSSFTSAIKLVPSNPAGYVVLAGVQTDHASALLNKAVQLNPHDAQNWIKLGFAAEFQDHDTARAEQYYLHAEQVNRAFFSKANLTNFYFRQQNVPAFRHWLPLALQMNPSNPSLLFAELWGVSADASANLAMMPNRPEILLSYADFLLGSNRFDAAEPALDRAMSLMNGKEPTDLLAKYVPSVEHNINFFASCLDRLLAAKHYQAAQRLASALSAKLVLPYPAPTAQEPLTNGDFRILAFQHGFDWRFAVPPNMMLGVSIDQFPESAKLRFTFSGTQPENCRLLEQYLVLEPDAQYRMEWDAESESVPKNSGFTWRLIPIVSITTDNGPSAAPDTAAMLTSPEVLGDSTLASLKSPPSASSPTSAKPSGSESPSVSSWTFTAPSAGLNILALEYHRNLGTTRPEGELSLRSLFIARQ